MSLIVNLILSSLTLAQSLPAADKTQWCDHLSFNSTLQWINVILSNLQKLQRYFNGTALVAFFIIPLAALSRWATVFNNDLALYLKYFILLSLAISTLKSVALSF